MLNVLLCGVGGQGTVLAAKILAQAAEEKGWQVRTAETIGMAQRGGSVVSHVRMGNAGEAIHAPLIAGRGADLVIAFEPAEAARAVPYLRDGGLIVSAASAIQPVSAALSKTPYVAEEVLGHLCEMVARCTIVDDKLLCARLGSRKSLNVMLLACALAEGDFGITINDLRRAVSACVKPQFVELNLHAIEIALETLREKYTTPGDGGESGKSVL